MPSIPIYEPRVGVPRSVPRTDTFQAQRVVNPAEGALTLASAVAQVVQTENNRREEQSLTDYDLKLSQADQKAWIGDDQTPGAAATEGRNAAGVTARALAQWDKEADAAAPKLTSPEAQARAQQRRAVRRQDLQARLAGHELQQGKVADAQTYDAATQTYANEAVANADDPAAVDASLARGRGAIAAYAKRSGWDETTTVNKLADWESGAVRGAINAQITRDPLKALATFKQRVDVLRGPDRIAIQASLRPYILDAQGRVGGAALYQGGVPTVAAGTPSLYNAIALTESNDKQFDATGAVIRGPMTATGERAVGRFQIMPGTGPEAAKLAGLPWDAKKFEDDQNYHAQLGRAYIDAQVERFNGNVPVIAAAYNMGPEAAAAWAAGQPYHTVSGKPWKPKRPMDPDALPTETRNYIAKVTDRMGGMPGPALTSGDPETLIAHGEADALRRAYAIDDKDERDATMQDIRTRAGIDRLKVQELGRDNAAQNAQLKDQNENVRAKLEDGISVPLPERLTREQIMQVYGPVEGPHQVAEQDVLVKLAPDRALLKTATPAQGAAVVAKYKADPSSKDYKFDAAIDNGMRKTWAVIQDARNADPMLYAQQNKLFGVVPIDPAQPGDQWQARDRAARSMAQTMRTPYRLLSTDEATAYSTRLAQLTPAEQLGLLDQTRTSVSPEGFRSIMGQVAGDQPLLSAAGSLLSVGDQNVQLDNGTKLSGKTVAATVVAGQALLNPPKGGTKVDFKADSQLRQAFDTAVGTAYRGQAGTQERTFQVFRAYYAARAAETGKIGLPDYDPDLADEALTASTGGITEVNDVPTVLPWGINEEQFQKQAEGVWPDLAAMAGLPASTPFSKITFAPAQGDRYFVMAGDMPLYRAGTKTPLIMQINRPKPTVPTSMTALSDSYGGGF